MEPEITTFTCEIPESRSIVHSQFDSSGKKLVSISSEGTVCLWKVRPSLESWELQAQWDVDDDCHLYKVAIRDQPLGSLIAAADTKGTVTLWQTSPKRVQPLDRERPDGAETPCQHEHVGQLYGNGEIKDLALSPESSKPRLAVASSTGLRILQPSPLDERQWQLESKVMMPGFEPCSALEWLPHQAQNPAMLCVGSSSFLQIYMYETSLMRWQSVSSTKTNARVVSIAATDQMCDVPHQVAVGFGDLVEVYAVSGSTDHPKVEKTASVQQEALVESVQWHPLGSWLAVGLHTKFLQVWRQSLLGKWTLVNSINTEY